MSFIEDVLALGARNARECRTCGHPFSDHFHDEVEGAICAGTVEPSFEGGETEACMCSGFQGETNGEG
jgi:hypothetical protein